MNLVRALEACQVITCFFLRLLSAFLSPRSLAKPRALVTSVVHCIWLAVMHICHVCTPDKQPLSSHLITVTVTVTITITIITTIEQQQLHF